MIEPLYESGWQALPGLSQSFDMVLVEAPAGAPIPEQCQLVHLDRKEGLILPRGFANLPEFQPDLMPSCGEKIESLPPWKLQNAPRCGVITLPHIDNFSDYQLLRGSEWLTLPAIGRFANLFLPFTTNAASDREWLGATGLSAWIARQCDTGARLSVCGWDYPGAERCERGDPLDFRYLSPLIGRRFPPMMPGEGALQDLADWFGKWPSLREFVRA